MQGRGIRATAYDVGITPVISVAEFEDTRDLRIDWLRFYGHSTGLEETVEIDAAIGCRVVILFTNWLSQDVDFDLGWYAAGRRWSGWFTPSSSRRS